MSDSSTTRAATTTAPLPAQDVEMPMLDFTDPRVAANPQAELRQLAEEHWIARTPQGYFLLRWEDVKTMNRDKRLRTPEGLGLPTAGVTEGVAFEWAAGTVQGLDGADHARIRRLAQPAFQPQRIEALRGMARGLFDEILSEVVPAGHGEASDVCMSYSVRMICRLLGWPEEDWRQILGWSEVAIDVASLKIGPGELPALEAALLEMRAYTTGQLEKLRSTSDDSFANALIRAEEDGDKLTTKELLDLFETLLVAGSDTTKSALTIALLLFARHPDQWEKLVADPSLVPSAVDEVLRFRAPTIGTARITREEVVYHGVHFPAGTSIVGAHAAANFDPKAYDRPFEFDITRFAGDSTVPKPRHMTFGFGEHVCIGNLLARIELQEAFKLLTERITNLRIDGSDPRGIEWSLPFGICSPVWLPLTWDPVPTAA